MHVFVQIRFQLEPWPGCCQLARVHLLVCPVLSVRLSCLVLSVDRKKALSRGMLRERSGVESFSGSHDASSKA